MNISNLQNSINQTGLALDQKQLNQTNKPGQIFKDQNLLPKTQEEQTTKDILQSVDKLVNKVINELNGARNTNETSKILQMIKDVKIVPNFSQDIKDLAKMIEQDQNISGSPELKGLALKLKEFLKPIADLKTTPLNEQIKNSGIMLEAKLKDALQPEKIPSSITKLLSDIKNLNNTNLLNQIVNLSKEENLSNHDSFIKLSQILDNESKANFKNLNNSNLKDLLSNVSKLDNMSKFLNKISANKADLSGEKIQIQAKKIEDFLTKLDNDIKNLSNEKLNQITAFSSNLKEFKIIIKDSLNSLNSLKKIGDEIGLIKSYESLMSSKSEQNIEGENSLQSKLRSAARRLSVILNITDEIASNAKENLDEIKHIKNRLKIASKDIANIEPKNSADTVKVLNSDIKSTLLNIIQKSENLNNASQISQMSSKMLSQIEIHQMISSVGGGLDTYLPYVWDGVNEGRVAFKKGKRDKFYAQIDLNFKEYGQVNIMIGLNEKRYIDLSIATAQNSLKELIMDNSKELKQSVSSLGLIISNFNIKLSSKHEISNKFKNFSGFEFGIDKKA